MESLKKLLDKLKTLGFLGRIFGWSGVRTLLVDAYAELQRLVSEEQNLRQNLTKIDHELSLERNDNKNLRDSASQARSEILSLRESVQRINQEKEVLNDKSSKLEENNRIYLQRGLELKARVETLESELLQLREQHTRHLAAEEQRKKETDATLQNFNKLSEDIRKERLAEIEKMHQSELDRLEKLKETWSNHEEIVKSRIKAICQRHGIEYVDKVPFKGNPDNTLKIKDEYIVFDAKSPRGEELTNFQGIYLKSQAESAGKYVNEEDVRREVFLVVPTNTLEAIDQFEYRTADYTVYVISLDALEPIILALKKIEEYEFAEHLSPEERENICRVIGKFVHLSKRRIQIDGFFAKQFFELVSRSDNDLPKEFLEKVVEFEKSEKLNPPIEKRAKQISTKELEADSNRISGEASQKGIITHDKLLSREINKLPLYSTEENRNEDQGELFGAGHSG